MINKLIEKIKATNAPIVVGLDPMLSYVPEHVQKKAFAEYGETLEGAAEAIWQFNKAIVDATYDLIPAVKPQVAMYEQFGVPGMAAYEKTVSYCQEKGLVVIGDVKRGDIGSTSHTAADVDVVMGGADALTMPMNSDITVLGGKVGKIAVATGIARYARMLSFVTAGGAALVKLILLIIAAFGVSTLWFTVFIDAIAAVAAALVSILAFSGELYGAGAK